jgi:hypothetical protein
VAHKELVELLALELQLVLAVLLHGVLVRNAVVLGGLETILRISFGRIFY